MHQPSVNPTLAGASCTKLSFFLLSFIHFYQKVKLRFDEQKKGKRTFKKNTVETDLKSSC